MFAKRLPQLVFVYQTMGQCCTFHVHWLRFAISLWLGSTCTNKRVLILVSYLVFKIIFVVPVYFLTTISFVVRLLRREERIEAHMFGHEHDIIYSVCLVLPVEGLSVATRYRLIVKV